MCQGEDCQIVVQSVCIRSMLVREPPGRSIIHHNICVGSMRRTAGDCTGCLGIYLIEGCSHFVFSLVCHFWELLLGVGVSRQLYRVQAGSSDSTISLTSRK